MNIKHSNYLLIFQFFFKNFYKTRYLELFLDSLEIRHNENLLYLILTLYLNQKIHS